MKLPHVTRGEMVAVSAANLAMAKVGTVFHSMCYLWCAIVLAIWMVEFTVRWIRGDETP